MTTTRLGILAAALAGLMALALPALASARDRNHDRIPDRWEKRHGLSLHVKQTTRDQDRDKLVNRKEFVAGLDPHDEDSDNDGVEDGDEGAGTIAAFNSDTGRLTINLFGGDEISGLVTDDTEISCDNGDDNGDEDEDGEGGDDDDQGEDDDDVDEVDKGLATSGEDSDDDDVGDDDEHACSIDNLTEGAVVQEAELELENGQAIFEEIELAV